MSRGTLTPDLRERAIVDLLDAWPWDLGGIVIGGYATAAYGRPRYSHDLDIALPLDRLEATTKWLATLVPPFRKYRPGDDWTQNFSKASCWKREGATIDLLAGGVRDRTAQVDIPYEWIAHRPLKTRLVLIEAATRSAIPVVRPEAFWALKLQAGRAHDLADLFAVHDTPVDLSEVRALFESLWTPKMKAKLTQVRTSLEREKMFHDALSRFGLGSPAHPRRASQWRQFRAMVESVIRDR